ncbi:hypothetical protein Droror1_Dr00021223 [Drosera rotundifolia]
MKCCGKGFNKLAFTSIANISDPFRPLWDLIPVPRLSLDWLPDSRCVITSYDDGTLRFLSLAKASCDVPTTGKPFSGTHQQGLHSLYCSPFAIWSVHVSRLTRMVAYCGADGNALHFQICRCLIGIDGNALHFQVLIGIDNYQRYDAKI